MKKVNHHHHNQHHYITTSPHHDITTSPHHHTTTSPHTTSPHHIARPPHHHISSNFICKAVIVDRSPIASSRWRLKDRNRTKPYVFSHKVAVWGQAARLRSSRFPLFFIALPSFETSVARLARALLLNFRMKRYTICMIDRSTGRSRY